MTHSLIGLNESISEWLPLASIVGFVLLSLGVFALHTAIHGRDAYLAVGTLIAKPIELIWPATCRPEHPIILVVLGMIAFFASLTSIQRTIHIRRELRKR